VGGVVGDEQFGPYRLDELIGRGGMGEVHRAFDTVRRRTVALKVLSSDRASGAEFRDRFRRELEIAAQLREPHVIPIHDHGEVDGRLFVDMRLVDGVDLDTVMARDGAQNPELAVRIVAQVAGALDAAHVEGLVHRDVKPSNALLTGISGEFAYLVDFGVAAPEPGAYTAPELFAGADHDGRTDVYALAGVLHKLLTGRRPFEAEGFAAIKYAHLDVAPPRPSLHAGVPAGFDAVVARGMAKDPQERFARAGELAAAAVAVLTPTQGPIVPGRPADGTATMVAPGPTDDGPTVVVPGMPVDEPTAVVTSPASAGWFRRSRVFAGVAVLVVAALAATGAVVLSRSGPPPPSTPVAAATTAPAGPKAARRYTDPDGRFTIAVPAGWGVEPRAPGITDPEVPVVGLSDPTPGVSPSGSNAMPANVQVYIEPTTRDLKAEIEYTKDQTRKNTPGVTITTDEPIALADGTPAHLAGGTFPVSADVSGRFLSLLVVHDGLSIAVSGYAFPDTWPIQGPKIDAALRSLDVGSR
jgi:serine/threonine-protein kinase